MNSQNGPQVSPQRLPESFLGVKISAGSGETQFVRNCTDFGKPLQGQNVAKTQYIFCFARNWHFPFWKPFGLHFGPDFGSLLDSFGPLGVPWGLQVDLQGVLEGVLDTTQLQTAKHHAKH